MTEENWLTSDDPIAMYRVVAVTTFSLEGLDEPGPVIRKRYLFCLACCRLVWPLIAAQSPGRNMVEFVERHIDATIPEHEERLLWRELNQSVIFLKDNAPSDLWVAADLVRDLGDPEETVARMVQSFDWGDQKQRTRDVADLLRCIVGNPFRPVVFDHRWRSETAVALAAGIYEGRAFDRLPILADALEEAGCDHPDVLAHCRSDGPHARGCWVVDLLLGKS